MNIDSVSSGLARCVTLLRSFRINFHLKDTPRPFRPCIMQVDDSFEGQQPPPTSTGTEIQRRAPQASFSTPQGTEGAGTDRDGSNESYETQQTASGQLDYGVRSRAYPLPLRPEVIEVFADVLAEKVLPKLGFTKAKDVPLVWDTAVWHSGQPIAKDDGSLVASDEAVRYGSYYHARYEKCENSSTMVILVTVHQEVVAHPGGSEPEPFVYFSRDREIIESLPEQKARVQLVRNETLEAYREHPRS